MRPTLKGLENWSVARSDARDHHGAAVGQALSGLIRDILDSLGTENKIDRGKILTLVTQRVALEPGDVRTVAPRRPGGAKPEQAPEVSRRAASPGLFGAAEVLSPGENSWAHVKRLVPCTKHAISIGSRSTDPDARDNYLARLEYGLLPEDAREVIAWNGR